MASYSPLQRRHNPDEPQDDDVIDLRQLWLALVRHKWGILALPVLVGMLTFLYVSTLTPIYQGQSTLLIEPDTDNVVGIRGVETGTGEGYLRTQFELLRSRGLAEQVAIELDLLNHPEFDPEQQDDGGFSLSAVTDWRSWVRAVGLEGLIPVTTPEDLAPVAVSPDQQLERLVSSFRNRITVEPRQGTHLVGIKVEMADRALAARAANAMAYGYIERQLSGRMAMTEQATGWMSNRLADLEEELKASERRLQSFVEREDLVDMGGVTTVEASELSQLNDRLVDARQEFARAENQFQQIADVTNGDWRQQANAPVVRSNSLVSEFLAAETRARARVEELAQRYGLRHPRMIEAQDELTAATESVRSQVEQVVASIQQSYQLSQANLASLQASFNENREAIREVQAKETEFRQLRREVDSNRTLYDTFLNRLNETAATADIQDANARVVDESTVPRSPVSPRVNRSTMLAAILALMSAIGLALLREALDNRVRGSSDVEDKLGVPMLGLMPLQKKMRDRSDLVRLYARDTDRAFSEAIRTIRTSVVLSALDSPRGVILVTSSVPGEGKTVLSANLAAGLGQMERVLLVEADMRKPSIRRAYGMDRGTPGLADVVAGNTPLEGAIHRHDNVDVLACGTLPPNPLELLSSNAFKDLLGQLRERYDRIIIDSPPVQAVSDPLVLATYADSLIYVVKSDATRLPMIRKGLSRLAEASAPLTGVVLDGVDVEKSRKYGYYDYKYDGGGYYDYYGYSSGDRG